MTGRVKMVEHVLMEIAVYALMGFLEIIVVNLSSTNAWIIFVGNVSLKFRNRRSSWNMWSKSVV